MYRAFFTSINVRTYQITQDVRHAIYSYIKAIYQKHKSIQTYSDLLSRLTFAVYAKNEGHTKCFSLCSRYRSETFVYIQPCRGNKVQEAAIAEPAITKPVTLVQARHLQIDSSLLSYSSRRPVDENVKLEGRKEEVEKQETSRYIKFGSNHHKAFCSKVFSSKASSSKASSSKAYYSKASCSKTSCRKACSTWA
jgi:hypothetical protein